jgi:3-oxoacyl-[acyl-carrier protein] reductase
MASESRVNEGKVVALTGATRGVGRAAAKALAASGALLVVNGRGRLNLESLCAEIEADGGRAIPVVGSVAEEAVAEEIVASCLAEFGRIDTLINNAGIVRDRTTLRMTVEEFDEVIATNLRGTWLCGREAARAMRETGGHLINVISSVAFHGSIGQSNYAASKSGAASLTRSWSYELARYGIRANAVWPIADTEMTQVVLEMAVKGAEQEGKPAPSAAEVGLGDPAQIAKVFVVMAGDLAPDLNAQIVTFNGHRLGLWTHSVEAEVRERDSWAVDELAAAFAGADSMSPQEMQALDLSPIPSP